MINWKNAHLYVLIALKDGQAIQSDISYGIIPGEETGMKFYQDDEGFDDDDQLFEDDNDYLGKVKSSYPFAVQL